MAAGRGLHDSVQCEFLKPPAVSGAHSLCLAGRQIDERKKTVFTEP